MMKTDLITYEEGGTLLEAAIAYPGKSDAPMVVVCHAWNGRDAFIQSAIEKIAGWGFVGFALDVFGKGVLGKSKEENLQLKTPFLQDRQMLQRRLLKGLEVARSRVDSSKAMVIGFGFGGLCALDLARSDSQVRGAISVYGHFEEAEGLRNAAIRGKILILHGAEDPIVPLEDLTDFGKKLSKCHVDWQAHVFGKTMHAFMNPKANDPAGGVQFNPMSAERSWRAIAHFLQEGNNEFL